MSKEKGKYPKRKHPRLKNYDYSQNGSYHVIICTKDNECILGKVIYNQLNKNPVSVHLSLYGQIADKYIRKINDVYDYICVDKYVIMPNHIHLLITIERPIESLIDKSKKHTDIQTVVRSLKRMSVNEVGRSFWQESFYESIIETDESYYNIIDYIEKNPFNWVADKYYKE